MQRLKILFTFLVLSAAAAFAQNVVISGDITTDMTLTANHTYTLSGFVKVQSGATLTIEPGTMIFGEYSSQGSLIVKPGGKINAVGTAQNPIVFTSEYAKSGASRLPTYGDWGGIILLGNARINPAGGTASIEGPGDSYGGTNDDDNSGVMSYVRIEYPGIAFTLNNEINGLTFGGVGRGTQIDHIMVSYSGDDSYEWFGGTVNCKYLIAYRGWDDEFDTDYGFSGKLQYLLGFRDPEIADQSGSNGFESDNDGNGSTNTPITSPTWFNVTLIGPAQSETTTINSLFKRGMHLRRNSQNKISNTLIVGWPTDILLDGNLTIQGAANGTNYIQNSIATGWRSKLIDTTGTVNLPISFDVNTWFTDHNNTSYASNSALMLTNPYSFTSPDFRPAVGSPALTAGAVPPVDGFFDAAGAAYKGAFGAIDWTSGWADWTPVDYTLAVKETSSEIPADFNLSQNYPNPFNPSTNIAFSLPKNGNVRISIYNMLGQKVADVMNEYKAAGSYVVDFNASGLSSGVYVYRLEAGNTVLSKKMSLLK